MTLSSRLSWVSCSAKSKGPKQSRPLLSIAFVRGECTPAKRSRNKRGGCLADDAGGGAVSTACIGSTVVVESTAPWHAVACGGAA